MTQKFMSIWERGSCAFIASVLFLTGVSPAIAWVEGTKTAAMIVYPLIRVDDFNDTIVEISNASGTPIGVYCTYLNGIGHCEFARPQFTRISSRVSTQPSCELGLYSTTR